MPASPPIESTLSHIILPCSLQPLPPQFSIAAIKIVAKNKAVLSIATGAPLLHGFSMLPHTPMGALVVKVYCPVEQLNPGGAGVLTHPSHQRSALDYSSRHEADYFIAEKAAELIENHR